MFPYGEFLHATTKFATQCTNFIPIKPNNRINIKCSLGFCDELPKYKITDKELDDRKMILYPFWCIYLSRKMCNKWYNSKWTKFMKIMCDYTENSLIKSPTYGKNKQRNKNYVLLVNLKRYIINQC